MNSSSTHHPDARTDALVDALRALLPIDEASLRDIARATPTTLARSGDVVCHQGDDDRRAFLVVTGRLSVEIDDGDGPREVRRLGRGEVVGELSLLTGRPRSATVTAVRDTLLAVLDEVDFRRLLSAYPQAVEAVVAQVADRAASPTAGRRRPVASIGVGTVVEGLDLRLLVSAVREVLAPACDVGIATGALVDRTAGQEGVHAAAPDQPGADLAREALAELEAAHDVLLLELPQEPGHWLVRAAGTVDRVMVAVPADADDTTVARARTILDAAPPGVTRVALVVHPEGTERPVGSAALGERLGVDDVLHSRGRSPADLGRAVRLVAGRGTALVLGGGGARGFAHIAVKRVLEELDVPVDLLVGASVGAPIAGGIGNGVDGDGMQAVCRRLFANLLDYTVPVTSLIKGEATSASISEQFDGWDYEDCWIPTKVVSTNLTRSRTEVHESGPMTPTVRASVSIPGVFPPVPWGDDLLIDGGVLNNLPVDVAAADGRCSTIIAVDVAPAVGPRAKGDFGLSVSGWQALRKAVGRGRSEFPGITEVLLRSLLVGSVANRRRALEESDVDLLVELDLRGISLLAFDDVDPVVDRALEQARPLLTEWVADRGGPAGLMRA